MRQVRVNAYEKALVFRNGELVRVLDQGRYWISPWKKVIKYDITELFYHEIDLDLLMKCENLRSRLNIVNVADNEIAIQYKNGNFDTVLKSGRYPIWKDNPSLTHEIINLDQIEVSETINRKVLHQPEVMRFVTMHIIESYEKGILYVNGIMNKELGPGVYYYWKGEQNVLISKVDTRKQQVEISGQELLTADKASIRMNLFAYYQVEDIITALTESRDYARQLYVMIQLGLREYVGQYTLDQLLRNKSAIAPYILEYADTRAQELGVKILDCGVRDIILPGDVKEIMNQVLVAEKQAQANTIMRREETASTRSLLNTARLMQDNDMLFKLKEMEFMEKIADKVGEITVNGGGAIVDQLRSMISVK
ncbi:MAG: slipin family protein [Saprospiraceae bacterium]|nr:slipin family protein [Saprospiraceae bacterium]